MQRGGGTRDVALLRASGSSVASSLSILAFAAVLLAATATLAQDDSQLPLPPRSNHAAANGAPANAQRPTGRDSTWKATVGALLFVTALAVLAAKFLRKGMPVSPAALPGEVVEVLGRKPLDYRHTLHVVRCGSRLLLLGSSNEGLRTLAELADPAEVERLVGLCQAREKGPVGAVGDLWKRWRGEEAPDAESTGDDVADDHDEAAPQIDPVGLRFAPRSDSAAFRGAVGASGSSDEEAA